MENPLNNPQLNLHDNPSSALRISVLEQIKSGSVLVTPKWRFTVKSVISGFGLVTGFLIVLFVATLIHFSMKKSGIFILPEFGGAGLKEFFFELPWIPILVLLASALALEFWLLRYGFAYRQPLLYSVFGVVACLTLGTVLVAVAQVHENVYEAVETNNVPIMRPFYNAFADPDLPMIRRGMVAELEDRGFRMKNRGGQIVEVEITRETRIAPPVAIRVGELVVVFGEDEEGNMRAIGIKHVPAGGMMSAPGMRP